MCDETIRHNDQPRHARWRCERCGYPLADALPEGGCPECGLPVADSDPARRTGPAWHRAQRPGTFLRTVGALLTRPRSVFRTMDLTGGNWPARAFLALHAAVCLALVSTALSAGTTLPAALAWGYAMVATKAVIALTYLEALGVAAFSKRHGWPVGLPHAERLACYAAVGWPPAIGAMIAAWRFVESTSFERWAVRLGFPTITEAFGWALVLAAFGLAILGFEVLVWLGVRESRYATRPRPGLG